MDRGAAVQLRGMDQVCRARGVARRGGQGPSHLRAGDRPGVYAFRLGAESGSRLACSGPDLMRSVCPCFPSACLQPLLDMPELLWKAFIDYEIQQGDRDRARELYERLLDKTKHLKVWLAYAEFEACPLGLLPERGHMPEEELRAAMASGEGAEGPAERERAARAVYERAAKCMRDDLSSRKEEAVLVLEAWREFERGCVSEAAEEREIRVQEVEKRMPRRVKRKRPVLGSESPPSIAWDAWDAKDEGPLCPAGDGREAGMEEYFDYVFPEEEAGAPNLKLLEAAYRWKKQKTGDA